MKNRYRNPWFKSCNTPRPEYYENDSPVVFEYRGVQVFKLFTHGFDFVLDGCCITQRAGCDKGDRARQVIDDLLSGESPCDENVARHLLACGYTPKTYEQHTEMWLTEQGAK